MLEWKEIKGRYGEVAHIDDKHYLSYNPEPHGTTTQDPMVMFAVSMCEELLGEPTEETALVVPDLDNPERSAFIILSGDYREEAEEIYTKDGLEALIQFFKKINASQEYDYSCGKY